MVDRAAAHHNSFDVSQAHLIDPFRRNDYRLNHPLITVVVHQTTAGLCARADYLCRGRKSRTCSAHLYDLSFTCKHRYRQQHIADVVIK